MRKGESRPDLYRARVGVCPICSAEFRAVKDTYRRMQKFCSKECWSRRNPPRRADCLSCAKEFQTYEKTKVYCSQSCRDRHYRIRFEGDKSHLWEGGKTARQKIMRTCSKYREWRKAVFERDNYRCQHCGARSGTGRKVVLNADHIKPLSRYPDLAYEVDNGRTLCEPCHKETPTYGSNLARWEDFTGKRATRIEE